ncbi:MAG: RNA polymerase sigma factor [Planctomycetes bacterium]|nr:RNA polymerase sigma factor [Planctomycetota bacterium]
MIARNVDSQKIQDLQDIQACLAGDGAAYEAIVRRHQSAIARRMWRFTRDRSDLEELVHETFVQAYMGLRNFRGEAPFEHWLNRIATRVGYSHWKVRSERASHPTVSLADWDGAGPDDTQKVDSRDAAEALHSLLAALPPRDRLVLTLLYIEERPVSEAADLAGWTETMVKVQAFRARKKLKAVIEHREKKS